MTRLHWAVLVATIISLVLAAAGQVYIAEVGSAPEPVLVQAAHRHGARSPITPFNQSAICGSGGCGNLNRFGRAMLISAGSWIREQYPGLFSNISSFDIRDAYVRSTHLDRTIQSADGLLHGLFPDNATFFPVVNTVNFATDTLLLVDALPAFHIPQQLFMQEIRKQLLPHVMSLLGSDALAAIGKELHLEDLCTNSTGTNPTHCALVAQDIAVAYEADGTLTRLPITRAHLASLNEIRVQYNTIQFAYNASVDSNLQHGSLGQNLAQKLVQNMKKFAAEGATSTPFFFEYSAHDTTMIPLCVTLGHQHMMLPGFGQMYVFELAFFPGAADTEHQWLVRAFAGAPSQQPADRYSYDSVMQPFPLNCISPNGTAYMTTTSEEYCPIDDLWRFINTTLPQSPRGLCYLSEKTLQGLDCSHDAPDPSSLCYFYRMMCPEFACTSGGVVSAADFSCQRLSAGKSVGDRKHVAVVAVLTTFGGLLVGLVCGMAAARLLRKRANGYAAVQ